MDSKDPAGYGAFATMLGWINLYNHVVTQAPNFREAVNLCADRVVVGDEKAASALPNIAGNLDV
ncbi:hypothetical protein A6U88_28150 [Agrobacterium sp. B131/95]|nr:hypothetical protein A6U88_28150 [Agrobacterium sp. B131/95]